MSRRGRTVTGVLDAGRGALARVADACRGVRLTEELVRGFAYERCGYCAAETLRCARAVAGIADAGLAAVAGRAV